jgi:hypothetical protein
MLSLQSSRLQSNTVVVVVVVVGVLVVDVVAGTVVVVVLVVEVVVVTMTATRSSTQFSTSPRTVGESVVLWQSLGAFAWSFAKQPFVGSRPPVYFASALSTQPFVFGSVGFPGVWASLRHLSSPARYFDAHFFLPAPHFV